MVETLSGAGNLLISPPINLSHGPSNHMFFSKELSVEVSPQMRSLVVSSDPLGHIPARVLDFIRIAATGPDGRTIESEINHNDHHDQPLGEQYVLSNVIAFQPGLWRLRFEFWSHYAPPGPNYGSTAVFLVQHVDNDCPPPPEEDPDCKTRVQVTQAISGHHMARPGPFLTRTVKLHVPKAGSRVVMSIDPIGTKPFGIDDWVNVTVETPSGKTLQARVSENDAMGRPVGEQWVLSNVIPFEAGCHTVTCELWNQFVPAGNNAGASAIWLVCL